MIDLTTMKNILTTMMLCITIACLAQDEVTVTFAGKIINPNSDTVYIMDGWGKMYELIELDEDHTFKNTFTIEKGYYRFNDGNESTTIFLNEGYDLYLTLDTDSFDETVSYTGNGASANNYLAKKALMKESWGRLDYYSYYCRLAEEEFLHLADSLKKVSLSFLSSQPISDKQFVFLEENGIVFSNMYRLNIYPGTYRYLTKDNSFRTSNNYPDPFAGFDVDDKKLIKAPSYLSTITDYLYYKKDSVTYKKTDDYTQYIMEAMLDSITNVDVKKEALHYFCKSRLTKAKNLDYCFSLYKNVETDPKRLAIIEEKYLARKKTENGASSPPFSYEDISGKTVSHEDLKGSYVYIDLWATWCGPCLREIPYFDTLQATFEGQNIQFVSVCQNDTRERWKATVEKKDLKGIQLYAEGDGGQFYKDYQVTGIPRYILLDPDGKIIDSDAKRPSDKSLIVELKELLN